MHDLRGIYAAGFCVCIASWLIFVSLLVSVLSGWRGAAQFYSAKQTQPQSPPVLPIFQFGGVSFFYCVFVATCDTTLCIAPFAWLRFVFPPLVFARNELIDDGEHRVLGTKMQRYTVRRHPAISLSIAATNHTSDIIHSLTGP